jgi:hypothetical protein
MSHFTTLKTQLVDGDLIAVALADLKIGFERGNKKIRGFLGQRSEAEFRIPTQARGYDIGIRSDGRTYEVIADWWGVRGFEERDFAGRLTRAYSLAATKSKLADQGFSLVSEQREDNGEVRLVLRRQT